MIFPTCFVPSVFFDFFLRIARFFLSKRPVFIWTFNITVEYYHWRSYFCYWEYFWITKQNHFWRFNNGDFSVSTKIHSLGLYRVFFEHSKCLTTYYIMACRSEMWMFLNWINNVWNVIGRSSATITWSFINRINCHIVEMTYLIL